MKRKHIIKRLEDIGKIANCQSKRFNDKKAVNKTKTLKLALDLITFQILKILNELEIKKKGVN